MRIALPYTLLSRGLQCTPRLPILPFRRLLLPCRKLATVAVPPNTTLDRKGSNPTEVRLRDYQEECVQSVLSHIRQGHKRLGISLATGSGKTVIFTQLIDRIPSPDYGIIQTLILVHRRELVEQAARHCINAYPSKTVEIEMGKIHASGIADITIASVQSLTSGDRIQKFDPKLFKLILVDEAHHIVAKGYMDVLKYFNLSEPTNNSPVLVGVSATFSRFDGVELGAAVDHIVYHKDYVDMIGEKWLSEVMFTTVESKADISKVKKGANGDFQTGDLSKAVNVAQINEITVRAWLDRADGRKSTLVFCVDIAHVTDLTETFRQHGIDARYITSQTPLQTRSERLDDFKDHKYPVLLNCGVFTEGTDIPNIDCVLLARPTKSRNLLVQMIGRGMRLYPGKKNCHIIDMVASLEKGIVTTPSLFGLDPSELVKEATVDQLRDLKEQKEAVPQVDQSDRRIVFTDYADIRDVIMDKSGERRIRAISTCSWVRVDKERWILMMLEGEYTTIERTVATYPNYMVRYTPRVPGNFSEGQWRPYQRSRTIAQATTFTNAVHAADTFVQHKCPRQVVSIFQSWRHAPASEGQLKFLSKLKLDFDTQITKGQAADMITKIKFGAKAHAQRVQKIQRRNEKAEEKNNNLRRRQEVRVGPIMLKSGMAG